LDADVFERILDEVRAFVRKEIVPLEREIDENDELPAGVRAKAAAMGLFGFALPPDYGGLGLSMPEDVRLAFELGYTTPAFRSLLATNNGLAGQVIAWSGTGTQREHYLPRLARGDLISSFALTEPEAGSDPSALTTRATRTGDGYLINGTKRFITNAPIADLFVVFARTGAEAAGPDGISAFLVERDTEGLQVGPKDHKMGQAGAWIAEVFLTDARVPAGALLGGEEGIGFRTAMRSLSRGRLHIAAICVGMADRLLQESVQHARDRRQSGQRIGDFQLVQAMLADSQTEVFAARSMVLEAARRYEAGDHSRLLTSACKLYCSEMVCRVADRAVQIFGGSGYLRGMPVERMYRDARVFRLYEGTSQIQQIIIGRELIRSGPVT
jgi:acyl-CoA dehydrogenase